MKHIILIVDSTQLVLAQERIQAIAAKIGFSVCELTDAIDKLASLGMSAEMAGESLRELGIRLENLQDYDYYDIWPDRVTWETPVNDLTIPQVVLTPKLARVRGPPNQTISCVIHQDANAEGPKVGPSEF